MMKNNLRQNKYYVKEVEPELTDSYLFYNDNFEDDVYANNVIIDGNNEYLSIWPDNLKGLKHDLDNFASDYFGYYGHTETLTELANYYFKKHNGKRWSKKELKEWKHIAELIDGCNGGEEIAFLTALSLITGKGWRNFVICGCAQRKYQYGYASEEITQKDIDYIEICYFNTGKQFNFYESEEDFNEDIPSTSYYVDSYDYKKQLLEHIGCTENELVIYEFSGYTKTPQYTKIN